MTENYTITLLHQIRNRQIEQDKKLDTLLARDAKECGGNCRGELHGASGESLNSGLENDDA